MIRRLAATATRNLNQFPIDEGISSKYSPLLIITRYGIVDYKLLSINFRAYVEIYEDNRCATSSNKPCSISAICIGLTLHRNPS